MDYLCIFILRSNEKENLKKSHIALINTVPHVIKKNNFDQHVINIIFKFNVSKTIKYFDIMSTKLICSKPFVKK